MYVSAALGYSLTMFTESSIEMGLSIRLSVYAMSWYFVSAFPLTVLFRPFFKLCSCFAHGLRMDVQMVLNSHFSHCVNLVIFSISDVMNGSFYCSFFFDKSCAKMISVIKIVHNIFVLSVYITDDNWLLYSLKLSKNHSLQLYMPS